MILGMKIMSVENQNVNKHESSTAEKSKGNINWQEFWKNEGLASPKRNEEKTRSLKG